MLLAHLEALTGQGGSSDDGQSLMLWPGRLKSLLSMSCIRQFAVSLRTRSSESQKRQLLVPP